MPIHAPEWASVEMDGPTGGQAGGPGDQEANAPLTEVLQFCQRALPSLSFPRMARQLPSDVCDHQRVLGSCIPQDHGATGLLRPSPTSPWPLPEKGVKLIVYFSVTSVWFLVTKRGLHFSNHEGPWPLLSTRSGSLPTPPPPLLGTGECWEVPGYAVHWRRGQRHPPSRLLYSPPSLSHHSLQKPPTAGHGERSPVMAMQRSSTEHMEKRGDLFPVHRHSQIESSSFIVRPTRPQGPSSVYRTL